MLGSRQVNPDQRLVNPDQTLVNLDQRLVNPDQTLVNPDQRLVNLDQTLVNLDQRLVNLDQTLVNLDQSNAGRVSTVTYRGGIPHNRATPSVAPEINNLPSWEKANLVTSAGWLHRCNSLPVSTSHNCKVAWPGSAWGRL